MAICDGVAVSPQGLAGEGEQTWTASGPELVPHLHAVVAAVERLRQICESMRDSHQKGVYGNYFLCPSLSVSFNWHGHLYRTSFARAYRVET